ncbi:MAG: ABC transporter permease [Steroidobacteraceae bacterium]
MNLLLQIAWSHLRSRRRQSIVSLLGVVLGVAFFLAVSSLMRGSERDLIRRLVDTAPHITLYDEYRNAQPQPARVANPDAAVAIRGVKPRAERRGIRQYKRKLGAIAAMQGVEAAPILLGQVIFSFAARDEAVSISGIEPARMHHVSSIVEDMVSGTIDAVDVNPSGIIIGTGLARKLSLAMNDTVTVVAPNGNLRAMKIVGLFETGNSGYDETQTFAQLTRVQALLNRPNIANRIVMRLTDPYRARAVATAIENSTGYKAVSWQEASKDLLDALAVRNVIMYSVVSAILIVACFGIYNVISTVVLEKTRDIAILKSMGFHAQDIRRIFLVEGALIGLGGSIVGTALGAAMMRVLDNVTIKPPGSSEAITLPLYWGADQFLLAAAFAIASAVLAAYLPARKGGRVQPVDILRGAA